MQRGRHLVQQGHVLSLEIQDKVDGLERAYRVLGEVGLFALLPRSCGGNVVVFQPGTELVLTLSYSFADVERSQRSVCGERGRAVVEVECEPTGAVDDREGGALGYVVFAEDLFTPLTFRVSTRQIHVSSKRGTVEQSVRFRRGLAQHRFGGDGRRASARLRGLPEDRRGSGRPLRPSEADHAHREELQPTEAEGGTTFV